MCMKFVPLYKGVILIVQDKYTNCKNGVQGYPLWRISIDFEQLFFFSYHPRTILFYYTFLYYVSLSCTFFNSHMTIQILTPIMMFGEKFCFCLTTFSKSNHWKYGSHILYGHIIYACRWNLYHYIRVLYYLYKANVLTVPFVKDFNRFWTTFFFHSRIAHSHSTLSSITHLSYVLYLTSIWQFKYLP